MVKKYATPYYWIKLSVVLSCISFLACAYNGGFIWFIIWRFIAGITCAILTIIVPSSVSQLIPVKFIGRTSGIIFSGMSGGIILAGIIVPILSNHGLTFIWVGFGIVAVIAMIIAFLTLEPSKSFKIS